MNKRNFLKVMAATAAVAAFSGMAFGATSSAIYEFETEVEYARLAGIEVKITNMVGDSQRTVLAISNKPIIIPEAKQKIAVVLAEHDSEHVSMTLLQQDKSGHWVKVSHSYAGLESTQIFRAYGIILDIIAARA